ncbi:XkdQ/YqbQ family protein [Cohnella abietis]|uniref:YqbQ/XkdQ domain-containing protein n=1 Tax=Cohnella abietis TaxID=2507935 RepID=A0A3T1D1X5_9BACL|nr:hypothetical protein [Cohnella abietis]BBI32051.1 hypothetical protein KCTCHS21_14500 [Cohnella abietis]
MIEILLDNREGIWNISNVVSAVEWTTARIGKASSLSITLIKGGLYQKSLKINNGDTIRVTKDGVNMFFGYVFEIGFGKDEDVQIKAYDQIRYLLSSDTYVFKGLTATEIIKRIANDVGLKTSTLIDTKYKIPSMVEDGKKLIDTIWKALDLTLINGGGNYVFYDDFGKLALKDLSAALPDFYIGDGSLLTDFDFTRSIDADTYNFIKVVHDNKKAGKRETYIAKDSANIAKWGRLQLYQSADEGLNPAQINDLLNRLAAAKNRESQKLKIEAIGDIRVRAGSYIQIIIGELSIKQPMVVEECSHTFDGDHVMSLELRVV